MTVWKAIFENRDPSPAVQDEQYIADIQCETQFDITHIKEIHIKNKYDYMNEAKVDQTFVAERFYNKQLSIAYDLREECDIVGKENKRLLKKIENLEETIKVLKNLSDENSDWLDGNIA